MEIHVASNGQSLGLECDPASTIQDLQDVLAPETGIPVMDQMLICGDVRLEPHRKLLSYKLPDEGRYVFLFNRSRLMADAPCPPPEEFKPIEIIRPPHPSVTSTAHHPLDGAADPVLRAIPSYEVYFEYHYQRGLAILSGGRRTFDACRQLLREQQVQELALETARGNMDFYYKIIDTQYMDFIKQYNRQHKQHSELLANFERDLERLRSCRLHPGLRTRQRETLLDCVKEGRVRKWADDCSVSFKQFNGKVADLRERYTELQRNVQALFYTAPAVNIRELLETIEKHAVFTEDQGSIIQSLSKDVNTVKRLVEDCVSGQILGSARAHDAVSALKPMFEVHEKNLLPKMELGGIELGKLLEHCQKSKNAMSRCVHVRLQSVAALQSSLKDMRNQLAVFKEAMNRQEDIFTELKIVRRTGSAYKACLAEAARRKESMKLYMGQAGQLAETLARKRESEVVRRDEFLRDQTLFFSRELLEDMGLYEHPSQCVVNIAPFDTNLLGVDIADLERYAPESLVGPLLKISDTIRRGGGGGVQSISDGGVFPGGGRGREDESDGEDLGSVEFLGTSKLEVENVWLKGELASAVARLCQMEPDVEAEEAGDSEYVDRDANFQQQQQLRAGAVQKTAEALRLKDEYAKQLHELLAMSQSQCQTYERRIRELEQRLQEQHLQKYADGMNEHAGGNVGADGAQERRDLSPATAATADSSESSDVTAVRGMSVPEPMDEGGASSILAPPDEPVTEQSNSVEEDEVGVGGQQSIEGKEELDKTMSEASRVPSAADADVDSNREHRSNGNGDARGEGPILLDVPPLGAEVGVQGGTNVNDIGVAREAESGNVVADGRANDDDDVDVVVTEEGLGKEAEEQIATLQRALLQKTEECAATEEKLKAALAEGSHTQVDSKAELLSECQINCAHLENRLHEAREQARVNQCAAVRRAAEYNALRASSVSLRGLMERLRNCTSASQSPGFEESLRKLALSLPPIADESLEDAQYRTAVRVLLDKVVALTQQRAELLERCTVAENNQQAWRSRLMRS